MFLEFLNSMGLPRILNEVIAPKKNDFLDFEYFLLILISNLSLLVINDK
ncbi:hypothetical protein ADIS_3458 [Lunatimonas lonarensis]|uniref:Transposase n=1 Tax=Lunatimonas lonarensis TaxID=1232681 RepID=R7ZQE0_9BACT|nr:hypothetical protein ADIS_3458 [Lunatimonas lonarensis]